MFSGAHAFHRTRKSARSCSREWPATLFTSFLPSFSPSVPMWSLSTLSASLLYSSVSAAALLRPVVLAGVLRSFVGRRSFCQYWRYWGCLLFWRWQFLAKLALFCMNWFVYLKVFATCPWPFLTLPEHFLQSERGRLSRTLGPIWFSFQTLFFFVALLGTLLLLLLLAFVRLGLLMCFDSFLTTLIILVVRRCGLGLVLQTLSVAPLSSLG